MGRRTKSGSSQLSLDGAALVVTCEHATNHIPAAFERALAIAPRDRQSHRAWDPGAARLARAVSRAMAAPVIEGTVSRLLVDLNRSASNPGRWSTEARTLPPDTRAVLSEQFHRPYWDRVIASINPSLQAGRTTVHIAVHSFTPTLNGVVRAMDIGLLYDPSAALEVALVTGLHAELRTRGLVVRRNAPYRGTADGLTRALRQRFAGLPYAGLELEVNQSWLAGARFRAPLARSVVASLKAAMGVNPTTAHPAPTAVAAMRY